MRFSKNIKNTYDYVEDNGSRLSTHYDEEGNSGSVLHCNTGNHSGLVPVFWDVNFLETCPKK